MSLMHTEAKPEQVPCLYQPIGGKCTLNVPIFGQDRSDFCKDMMVAYDWAGCRHELHMTID